MPFLADIGRGQPLKAFGESYKAVTDVMMAPERERERKEERALTIGEKTQRQAITGMELEKTKVEYGEFMKERERLKKPQSVKDDPAYNFLKFSPELQERYISDLKSAGANINEQGMGATGDIEKAQKKMVEDRKLVEGYFKDLGTVMETRSLAADKQYKSASDKGTTSPGKLQELKLNADKAKEEFEKIRSAGYQISKTYETVENLRDRLDTMKRSAGWGKLTPDVQMLFESATVTGKEEHFNKLEEVYMKDIMKPAKEYQPKLFVKPDGSLDWVKPGDPIPKGWVDASEKGFSVEFDPESKSFKIIQGPAGMIGQMAKPTQTKIETGILDAKEQLARIDSISEEFKPEYQEIGSRLGASWTGLKAKFGQGISETDTKFLIEFKKYQRKSIENINKYIKEITGAAMSEAEANRLRLAQPDPGEKWYQGDDPITFKAKLDDITKMTKLSLARYQMYLNQGMNDKQIKSLIQTNKVVSIESVEDIMRKRSSQIIQSLRGTDIGEEEARKIAKEQLKREFGL